MNISYQIPFPVRLINKRQITGTPIFTQTLYSFTVTSCTAGGIVGQVFATVSGGIVTSYTLSSSSGQFSISSTGLITLNTASAQTETFTVTAFSSSGLSASVPVTVTGSCSSGSSSSSSSSSSVYYYYNPTTPPTFQASSYSFSVACSGTQRLSAGLISVMG